MIRKAPKDVFVSHLEKRRTHAIKTQKVKRRALLQQLRAIDNTPNIIKNDQSVIMAGSSASVTMSDTKMDQDAEDKSPNRKRKRSNVKNNQKKNRAEKYLNLFMIPEWLIETPKDLGEEWTVMARPEGQRCLVRSRGQKTVCRGKNGGVMFSFNSKLPGGNPAQQKGEAILDCVYQKLTRIFWVVDIILWNGVEIAQKPWAFRSS